MKKNKSASSKYASPYPSSAKVLRSLAAALGTKDLMEKQESKKLDGYIRDGYYQIEKQTDLLKHSITAPLKDFLIETGGYKKSAMQDIEININKFFNEYHELVTEYTAAGLTESQTSGLLTFFFGYFGYQALADIHKNIFGSNAQPPEFKDKTVIKDVFKWIHDKIPTFSTKSKNQYSYNPETESRWKSGKQIPTLNSLKAVIVVLRSIPSISDDLVLRFTMALIYARAHDYFLILKKNYLLKDAYVLYKSNPEIFPVGQRIIQMSLEKSALHSESLSIAIEISKELEAEYSDRMLSLDDLSQQIELFKKTVKKTDHNRTLSYLYPWMKGKLSILCGETKTSLACYKKAFEFSLYLGGNFQEQIIKEAIVIAARHNNRVFLNKLKNQGIALGIYNYFKCDQPDPLLGNERSRIKNSIVEDWEVKMWRDEFQSHFPPSKWFPEAAELLDDINSTHIIVDTRKHAKPDLRNPDRVIQISERKPKYMPQIVYYSAQNETHQVEKLLEYGADIFSMTPEGESALLFAIQKMNKSLPTFRHGREKLFLTIYNYLKPTLKVPEFKNSLKHVVNTPTVKRKLSPLSCAVETGKPDIVAKVIELGADTNQRAGIDHVTPLYTCLGLINSITSKEQFQENVGVYERMCPPEILEDTFHRYCGPLPDTMGALPEFSEIMTDDMSAYNCDELIKIAKILLENKADPNSLNSTGLMHNYTPLMLSIETNNIDLFDLLIQYNGDPNLTCFSGINGMKYTCKDIAHRWSANNILQRLN